jgi:fumarylacetoacetase
MIDATHDPDRRSWVGSANGHPDFPIQNLPLGIFSPAGGSPRGGVAIGDRIVDLAAAAACGLLTGPGAEAAAAAAGPTLNPLMALGTGPRTELRRQLSDWLDAARPAPAAAPGLLHEAALCRLHLPAAIGDYSDFFAGIQHALNTGRQFRPDNPLLPNYKHLPVAYHGRSSSIRPSGEAVRRPNGQRKPGTATDPSFGPSRNLDYELELGIWIGPGNPLGAAIPIGEAASHIAGYCLLNDWSARDIQGWEYQPLGPFLGKSFHTTISTWVVTPEALAPFRIAQAPRDAGDPQPLAYLLDATDQSAGALDLTLEVLIETVGQRDRGLPPERLSVGNARQLYWTPAQMVAHHASGGCNLRPGDLFGSGTISGPTRDGYGSLLEISNGGRQPIRLASGEERRFLEDGDAVIFRARAERPGFVSIGFGECRGVVTAAAG